MIGLEPIVGARQDLRCTYTKKACRHPARWRLHSRLTRRAWNRAACPGHAWAFCSKHLLTVPFELREQLLSLGAIR